jgi:lysophospholipase L1-like esterase
MRLEGKIINFLGDSITEGCGVIDQNNRYDNILLRKYSLKSINNYGISGTRIAHQSSDAEETNEDLCFCRRVEHISRDADIVIVYGGVNDYLHGDAPFGCESDDDPSTFCGAVNYLMTYLKNMFVGKCIIFMTPAHCFFEGVSDKEVSRYSAKKSDSKPLNEYVKVIINSGIKHEIPVLNLFDKLGIDANNPDMRKEFIPDGLHFNDKGHNILAECLGNFLELL